MKLGCSVGIFLNSANLICQVRISRSVSEGPFDFEITRVDCMCFSVIFMNGNNFYGVYMSFKDDILLLNGVTLKGKSLLL